QDIILLAQTEVGGDFNWQGGGGGGGGTRRRKSNPITGGLILPPARTNRLLFSGFHQAQIQKHERATHGWQVEGLTLPQMIVLTGSALNHALYLAKNLQIDEEKMRENITRAGDVILAEAAVFALAKAMPRGKADELVKRACGIAVSDRKPLIEVVRHLA